jgi:hypothetical protein
MNLSDHNDLLKLAIQEGCKTARDLAEFIKNYHLEATAYKKLAA